MPRGSRAAVATSHRSTGGRTAGPGRDRIAARHRRTARAGRAPGGSRAEDLIDGHGVEGLDNGEHASPERDLVPRKGIAVARAIEPGADVFDDRQNGGFGAGVAKDLDGHAARLLEGRDFVTVQGARLEEDLVRHADHAHVVQQGGYLERVALRNVQTALFRPGGAVQGDAQGMAGRAGIAKSQRGEQAAGDAQTHEGQVVVDLAADHWGEYPAGSGCLLQFPNGGGRRQRRRQGRAGVIAKTGSGQWQRGLGHRCGILDVASFDEGPRVPRGQDRLPTGSRTPT